MGRGERTGQDSVARPRSIAHGRTLRGELERQTQLQGDKTWLIFERVSGDTRAWTYRQFRDAVYQAAHLLQEAGVGPGDKLLLHLTNCPEFLILWFAAASIGAVIVPTNPLAAPAELEYLCEHSEAVLVVVGADALDRANHLRVHCPRVRDVIVCGPQGPDRAEESDPGSAIDFTQALATMPTHPPDVRPLPDDDIAVMYTSGTTSKPKGCLITNMNYVHVGEAVAAHMGVTPADRLLAVLPLFHG
ncbi:MAG TPA: class I adenylate-forming enzyme family protein, partial [Candidatus Tectomicrobia bacterium]|nr:class I adenylate-forming enzyme family protein [Candidatus Tectomicrobia bacterium]